MRRPLSPPCYRWGACVCVLSCFNRVQFFATPWTAAHQAPLSTGFSRQEHWSGVPCPPPGDLPHWGTEPTCLVFLDRQVGSSPRAQLGRVTGSEILNKLQVASEAGGDAASFITALTFSSLILKIRTAETWSLDRSEINKHKTVGHNT